MVVVVVRGRCRFESDAGGELSVYAVSRPAFILCRRPRRDAAADDVDRLSQNISATVTRRHLRHAQSNYFIGTSSIHSV